MDHDGLMVDELLTQINSFKGFLVVTTNLFNQIDPAALRRFDFKVNFNYLNSHQIGQLWDQKANYFCLEMIAIQGKRLWL